jgi:hypothetical protein
MDTTAAPTMCITKKCIIQVGDNNRPNYWAKRLVGAARKAIEVFTPKGTTYIDNEDGSGWLKVTENPNGCYRELKAEKVIGYLES